MVVESVQRGTDGLADENGVGRRREVVAVLLDAPDGHDEYRPVTVRDLADLCCRLAAESVAVESRWKEHTGRGSPSK